MLPTGVEAVPASEPVPAFLLQAARTMLGISQAELSASASVSKKMINDIEIARIAASPSLGARLREALEAAGARFVRDGQRLGVVTVSARHEVAARSRSPRLSESPSDASFVAPPAPARGRPRKLV